LFLELNSITMTILLRRSIKYLLVVAVILNSYLSFSQTIPPEQWAQRYGGSGVDIPFAIKFTADGGTILAGYTDSKSGDVTSTPPREYWDLWVLKTDACGNIQWEKSLGGTGYESARDIEQTADGGYIVLGETNSTDGDVVKGYGGTKDIWLIKLSASGNVQWQKRLGGSGLDIGNQIKLDTDGNYLIAASSSSNDGDIKGNHGTGGFTDGVLMKISPTGNLLWSKCFGGSKNEELFDIELINGKIFISGYSNSIDGDIPPNQKNYDVWLLCLDAGGNKIFSKIYGGSQNDVAYSMCTGFDGNLTLAGYTTSRDGDVSGAKGRQDYWVLNIDQSGKLNWQKALGGSEADYARVVLTDKDSSYIVGGISYSPDGDVTGANGDGDFWVLKLSSKGNILWKKNWGGSGNDHLRSIIHKPALNEYYLIGDSDSNDGDFDFEWGMGDADFGMIKLKEPNQQVKDSTVCTVAGFIPVSDTLRDACNYDSVYVTYKPVLIQSPFEQIKKRDTIFAGEKITLPSLQNGNITWMPHSTLSCTDCKNPVANPTATTVYTATNTSPLGCSISDAFTLVVLNDALVLTPNAFTPNSDGLNDWFGPVGKVPDTYSMKIFNRFGELVYKSSAINSRWDGKYKGNHQPPGTYIYQIRYLDMLKQPKQQKGSFILIR
jgi:gliding motility-associated-like protein